MTFSKNSFFVAISAITILGGCLPSQFKNNDKGDAVEVFYPTQQTLTSDLMSYPETSHSSETEKKNTSYEEEYSGGNERMANLELPSNAVELFPASIAGVWNLSVGGKHCRIATPQTKFGRGYRAAPLRCPGIVSRVNSWAIKGKKLYFYDNSGRIVVSLYSSNINRFEGHTLDYYQVILSR
ncbi:AprI/Inh family metalloprotease inhibitor [Bartonella sp. CB175]|uniref:AprI/Inh family metalloprotease inhibitor n=1 Tax=Bartonella sp. CB175 TaxID=3112256 RepID=UPI00300E4F12